MKLFFKFAYNFYKDQKKYFLMNGLLSLLNSFSKIFIPIYLKFYVDSFEKDSSFNRIFLYFILFILLMILNGLFNVLWNTLNTRIGADILLSLREKVMFVLENGDYEKILSIDREKIKHTIYSDTLEVFRVTVGITSNLMAGGFVLGMIFIYLFINQKIVFILTLIMFLIGFLFSLIARRRISQLSSMVNLSMKKINAFCNVFVDGLQTNRNQNLSTYFKEKHKHISNEFKSQAVKSDFTQVFLKSSLENFNYLFSMVFITYFLLTKNSNDFGNALLMVYYTNILIGYSQNIETLVTSIGASIPAFEKINSILSVPVKDQKGIELKSIEKISVKNIYYSYFDNPVLSDISFVIGRGERILIRGKNGTGKSTLLNIISGLLVPNSGECFVNDISYNKINNKSFIDNVLYVSHSDILLEENIYNYIKYSLNKNVTSGDLLQFAKDINILNIEKSDLDPYGMNISSGEKKKILLMKLLLGIPHFDLIIIDEIDANLDIQTKKHWNNVKWNLVYQLKDKIYIEITHDSYDERFYTKIISL